MIKMSYKLCCVSAFSETLCFLVESQIRLGYNVGKAAIGNKMHT